MTNIPKTFQLGGQEMQVEIVKRLNGNCLGQCTAASGLIQIAQKYNSDSIIPKSIQVNTFYHELVHAILFTMGERDLDDNEKFVSCFASFLTEAINSFKYE